ncbi:hypothetical protein ACFL09_02710 [Planctomycetota bacterium]
MNPQHTANSPDLNRGYVPYFYQAGLYHFYPIPSPQAPVDSPSRSYARYDFASGPDPWKPLRGPQTVEQIIQHGYFAVPRTDPETALISDRKDTSWLGLEDAIRQIRDRYRIHERNIYEIQLGKCSAITSLFTLEAERGSVPAESRELYGLSKLLQRFYQEEREERVKLWEDVSRLRQSLPEVAQQYLAAYRKMEILKSDDGDAL